MPQTSADRLDMATVAGLQLEYEGSVKNVFGSPSEPESLWFQFTDDYSVFDWGKMPDKIAHKGKSLALMGAYIFEQLADANLWAKLPSSPHLKKFNSEFLARRWQHPCFAGDGGLAKSGLKSHFLGLVDSKLKPIDLSPDALASCNDPQPLIKVMRAQVNRPTASNVFGQNLYFYDSTNTLSQQRRLIPLEVVFRFGMGKGSSLIKRLQDNPNLRHQLGFSEIPATDEWFDHPIIEFFTKLEAKDRLLSWQEASLLSGLPAYQFEELVELSLDTALALHHFFFEKGLELWDGKFEFILDPKGDGIGKSPKARLLLADSIGPDELRLIFQGQQISKELIRQYYRGTSWEKAVQKSLEMAHDQAGRDWKDICLKDLKESPAPLPPQMKAAVDKLYAVLASHLIGKAVFPLQTTLNELVATLDASLVAHDRKN